MPRRSMHIALRSTLGIGVFFYGILVFAQEMGITGVTRKNPNPGERGCTCHGPSPSPNVSVFITGHDTLVVNQTAVYTLTMSGGPAIRGGTNIAASAGSLAPLSLTQNLQLFQGELTHKQPEPFLPSGQVSFQFAYTAPASTGIQTLYANGNSTNFNRNTIGDEWNFAPDKQIVVRATPTAVAGNRQNVPTGFSLFQNYPNPFNPSTIIAYELPADANVTLKVYDLRGREIATLVKEQQGPGFHRASFNAPSDLPSGMYLYKIVAGSFSDQKSMMFVK